MSCRSQGLPMCLDDKSLKLYFYSFNEEVETFKWDILKTFILPLDKGGKFWSIENLNPDSFEFKYVAFKFSKTYTGIDARLDSIPGTIKIMDKEYS